MPVFNFKAINKEGQSYEGTMESVNRAAAYQKIKNNGDTPVYIHDTVGSSSFNFHQLTDLFSGKVKTQEKIIFARNLGSMIDAGLSVSRALSVMERQTKNKKLKAVLTELIASIDKGETMSQGMQKFPSVFSSLFVSMTRAGEEGGNLSQSLKTIGNQMEKIYTLQKRIQGALIYPAIILVLMFGIAILMLVLVVPTLSSTFKELGVELPFATQLLVNASDFLTNNLLLVIFLLMCAVGGFLVFKRTKQGKRLMDLFVLRLPLISTLTKEINSARTTRTLSSLLIAGVDLIIAIRITSEVVQNSFYKDLLKKIEMQVEKGENISTILSKRLDLYPLFVSEMASVGEETGKLSEMLMNVAQFYEDEVDQKTKDMSTIVEPVLMIVIGIAVGFFVYAMIGPTYSLVDVIQ
ncbi:MAG: type II secretion system F family protein [Patescibacteria group bacterium]